MNICFISIALPDMNTDSGGFYADLIRGLAINHKVSVLAPSLDDGFYGLRQEGNCRVLRVPSKPFIGNIPIWKKGCRLIMLSHNYIKAYKKFLGKTFFDVVFMPTPPMNFVDVFKYIKRKSGAKTYLILRDIHPDCLNRRNISPKALNNPFIHDEARKPYAVNILIQKYLKAKARELYKVSDIIGCMSPENCNYIKRVYSTVREDTLKVLPNWYAGNSDNNDRYLQDNIREKYNLRGKYIAIFGGTIGEAQAIWNIVALAKNNLDKKNVVFLVVGRGSKKQLLQQIAHEENISNIRVLDYLPREDYENILALADVGIISIDEKYSVPTCPSKIIGYMALKKPVLAIFNKGNDYGEYYIDRPECGFWSADLNYEKYFNDFDKLYYDASLRKRLGDNGFQFYKENLTVGNAVKIIEKHINE